MPSTENVPRVGLAGGLEAKASLEKDITEGNNEVLQVIDLLNLVLKYMFFIWTSSLKEGLAKLGLTQSFIRCCPVGFFDPPAGQKMKFQWQTFLSECYSKGVIIINWPADTPAPGPGFVVKALKPVHLAHIVDDAASDEEKVDEDHPEWECHHWVEEWHDIPNYDPRKADIPLVSDEHGYTLWALSDCDRLVEVQKKAVVKQHPFKCARDTVAEDAEVLEWIWNEYGPEKHLAAYGQMKPEARARVGVTRAGWCYGYPSGAGAGGHVVYPDPYPNPRLGYS
ncbi:hypothetical protein BU15DRAFT_66965 [Melanogaster broomeanus]|nr:hypothetical protein BU15DRAFT_66965 [Melanogaster broomeanus]